MVTSLTTRYVYHGKDAGDASFTVDQSWTFDTVEADTHHLLLLGLDAAPYLDAAGDAYSLIRTGGPCSGSSSRSRSRTGP